MKKIVLVNPSIEEYKEMKVIPEGLCLVAAVILEKFKNFEVKIIDAQSLDYSFEETIKKILDYNPDYLGIGATILSIFSADKIAMRIKNELDIPIILGGAQITLLPNEVMKKFKSFDYGVVGEGERTIVELLDALEKKKKNLSSIKGIIYNSGKKINLTKPREVIEDLDEIPMPAWNLLEKIDIYSKSISRSWRFPAFSFLSSRGCPGQCIFCPKLYGPRIRAYSAERLIQVVKYLQKEYKIKHIDFYDDNFVVFRDRLKKFCQYIIENKLDLTWTCLSRVNHINKDVLKLMKQAGCKKLEFGIESGNQKILDFEKKDISLEQVRKAVNLAHNQGIETAGFFILGHPLETKETLNQTINFAKNLDLDDAFFSYMVPYPGTYLYNIARDYGTFEENWENMNQGSVSFVPTGLKKENLVYFYKRGVREFYFRPKVVFRYLKKSIRQGKILDLFKQGIYFLKSIKKGNLK